MVGGSDGQGNNEWLIFKILNVMSEKRVISAIKIKSLRYGEVLSAAPTAETIAGLFTAATEISNSHQDTFTYEEAEPTVNSYKNQLNGQVYRSDVEPGAVSISFSIGAYDFETKAAMQGGTVTAGTETAGEVWARSGGKGLIYKSLYALTEDNVCIVFPKALISGRGVSTDNAIAVAVKATPEEISGTAIASEYWFDVAGESEIVG